MNQSDAGTPTWLAAHNDRAAFRLLLEHGPLTRSQLGAQSGVSKPTAGQMITRLERVGLIGEAGVVSGGRGPNAMSYGVRTDRLTGVAVSISGRAIHSVLVDAADTDHPIVELPAGVDGRSPEGDVERAVGAACEAAGVDFGSVTLAAVGVQAAVFVEGDELSHTDTLPGWPAVGARRRIEEALGLDVVLDNDVNLAAMAERATGVAQGASSFVQFWIGEGLGVGIVLGGVVHRGASGGAGEIGYLEVARSAARLDPAAHDLTELLGGCAVAELLGAEPGERLAEVLPRLAGDEAALDAVAARTALAIEPLLTVLDPALVVLGGPTGVAGGERLAALVGERVDTGAHPKLVVATSGTGEQPVLLGARQLLVEQIRTRLEAGITPAA
ncbi:ROK family transcriptional regulator [Agromyces italicus]|uniref:ROK family transcriptional regulator n=1 Tax=Agromyces italicus TaxID=279572 RepID=UPI00047CA1BF|nr:ROK family transcriptional regulator [Agromyces italicus]